MNLGGGRGSGSISGPTRKPGDASSGEFPVGLRVLVVDDDPTCLKILERMLITCRYEVTKCNRVDHALNELRMNKNGFDVVISDVHMPNMDGFKLLERVGLEMDLPVIMMSADDSKNVVMKGIKHGACDYLTKPVRMDALKNIWQHVVRKKRNEWQEFELWERGQKHDTNEDDWKSSKRKGDDEEAEDKDDFAAFKKARVVWSVELHQQFVAAVDLLGIGNAVPKKILELMNVRGLTSENVASHLQKYRLCFRKLIDEPQHLGVLNNSFMGPLNPVVQESLAPCQDIVKPHIYITHFLILFKVSLSYLKSMCSSWDDIHLTSSSMYQDMYPDIAMYRFPFLYHKTNCSSVFGF